MSPKSRNVIQLFLFRDPGAVSAAPGPHFPGGLSSVDNGISQEVSVRTGAVLKEQQTVQPIVRLQPYRTFLEVEQPASDFLLRLDKEGRPALYEADGGAWKLEAKRSIAAYLGEQLADLVESGNVVVMI